MKEIYTFIATSKVEKQVPIMKKVGKENVQSTKSVIEDVKTRIVFVKPSMSTVEAAEFFYGQKFNEYINAGFLTRAMLNKKMGDIGGLASKMTQEGLQKLILDNINATQLVEFYGGSKTLNEEQTKLLEQAKEKIVSTRTEILEYEQAMRSQFSQTADTKAEQKLIEWLVFNQSFYEEEVDNKKQLFPLFAGDSFDEKRALYLELCEDISDIQDPTVLKIKNIFDQSFSTLVRVASIWYNKIADTQETIDKALQEMFDDTEVKVDTLTSPEQAQDETGATIEASQEG